MANAMQTNKKVIALALGAVNEMAYLYAGADKGIESEMQGKDNGDTIYYKVTQLGDPKFVEDIGSNGSGDDLELTATDIKQATVPVKLNDSCVMYNVKALERQITSIGENVTKAKVGAKLGKKAVGKIISKDEAMIGNIFVADTTNPFASFQKATSYLKSSVEGTIFGFMDWQVWGDLTGKGQTAIPCALAAPEFGKNLEGKWALIDQLRTVNDIATTVAPSTVAASGITADVGTDGTIKLKGTSAGSIKAGDFITIAGVYAKDVNDMKTNKLFVFQVKSDITVGTTLGSDISASLANYSYGTTGESVLATAWYVPANDDEAVSGGEVKSIFTAKSSYAACIIRADGAQAFGTMKTCDCEGAQYSKSELDGVTVHENGGENIPGLKTEKRFDMIFASKLVEPRAAALILYPLS